MKTLTTTFLLTLAIAVLPFFGNAQDVNLHTDPSNPEYVNWDNYTAPFLPTIGLTIDVFHDDFITDLGLNPDSAEYVFEVMFRLDNGATTTFFAFEDYERIDAGYHIITNDVRPYSLMPGYTFGQSFEIGIKLTVGISLGQGQVGIIDEFYSDFMPIDVPSLITSISNQDNSIPFALYGNPTSDYTMITTAGQAALEIYDATGRLIHQQSLQGGRVTIDVSDFDKGHYIVRALTSDNQLHTDRLIIK